MLAKTFFYFISVSFAFSSLSVRGQGPASGTTSGQPSTCGSLSTACALVLTANDDAGNNPNEFIYFKVPTPGVARTNADWYITPTAWMTPSDFHLFNVNLRLYRAFELELGKGTIYGKEQNAGKIAYQKWSDGLDITGAGTTSANRKITFWNEGGASFNGPLYMTAPVYVDLVAGIRFGNSTTAAKMGCFDLNWGGLQIEGPSVPGGRLVSVSGKDGIFLKGPSFFAGNMEASGRLLIKDANSTTSFASSISPNILNKYSLFVEKGVLSEDYAIGPKSTWADYVFEKGYVRQPLSEVEDFIKKNKHLPGLPSAKEVAEDGYNIHAVNTRLLEKIEELTLFIIEQQKDIEMLKKQFNQVKHPE